MWKLIVSEWKKIFRSRLNIFLLLFLIGYTLFSMCSYTFGPISYEEDLQFATFEGEPLQTYAKLYAYADQVLAQYEGEVDEALWERFCDDYNALYAAFTTEENIDQEQMEAVYGADWRALLERNETRTLTATDIALLDRLIEETTLVSYDAKEGESPHYTLHTLYKDNSRLHTLLAIYRCDPFLTGMDVPELTDDDLQGTMINVPLYRLLHPRLLNMQIRSDPSYDQYDMTQTHLRSFIEVRLQQPFSYGSAIGPALLQGNLRQITMLTVLVLAVICANTFAIERSSGVEPIIVSARIPYTRIALAKILANELLAIALFLLLAAAAFVISASVVSIRGLDLPSIRQISELWIPDLPYLTNGQVLQAQLLLQLLACGATAILASLFSALTKSRFLTILLLMLCLLVPQFLYGQLPAFLAILSPSVYFDVSPFLTSNPLLYDPLLSEHLWVKDLLWGVWLVIAVLSIGAIWWQAKRHSVHLR